VPNRAVVIRVVAACVTLVLLLLIGKLLGAYVLRFSAAVGRLGPWGPIAFIVGYVVGVILWVPASLFTLAAGAMFGLGLGTVYVMIGAYIGATVSFLIARYAARGVLERRLAESARFAAIDRAVGRHGRRIVLLLRLSPVIPFSFLNYALGVTRVSLADYVVGMVGMVPATMAYVYFGALAGGIAVLAAGGGIVAKGPVYYGVFALGLVATVVVTVVINRAAARALAESTGDSPVAVDA
jgi:uncharacterized membrane protein YdjX (TVP38/TMEM64 family)